jgi:hypothetical protein
MTDHTHDETAGGGDLEATERLLRSSRLEPTPLELDRALTTARKRAARAGRHTTGGFMRSKIAIVSILAMGFVTSGAGATLAFQGSSGSDNASTAGYAPQPNVPNSPDENTGDDTTGDDTTGDDTTGTPTQTLSPGSETNADTQDTRQAAADDGKLPFTGLAAIPVIAIGLGLLATGVLLQRRTARERG